MRDLPTGTVTFLFTDIEGSTRLIEKLGEQGYVEALAEHRRLLREAFNAHDGVEVDTQGDAFLYAFPDPAEALAAAAKGQEALASGPVKVRIGVHTGEPRLTGEGYAGKELHRAARICAAAHGGQVVLSEHSICDEVRVKDLGLHRLKDLTEPVKLYQLGVKEFPPIRSLNATNLPIQPGPLIGRECELEEMTTLVRGGARMLTLTGPGGTGKTRLALQVATQLVNSFPDGVFWVPFAALRDSELVLPTIEQTLGVKTSFREHVDEKRMLLLLDNLEHLLEAAPQLSDALAHCPNLQLLVTSRTRLRIAGERDYQVPPLSEKDGVALFRERAPDAEPETAIAAICRRLDGLPLAIELAAARTLVLPPAELLERLERRLPLLTAGPRDAPERQRTLGATIAWSYELLKPPERRLFLSLSVFAGGWTLNAAEDVCAANVDTLESLLEQSLIRRQGNRFTMLETIREFASDRLANRSDSSEISGLHARHFLRLAEAAEPQVLGREQRDWLARLECDFDNLRAALSWWLEQDDLKLTLRLSAALIDFWDVSGRFREGRRWLVRALASYGRSDQPRAKGLLAASLLAYRQGDTERSRVQAHESVDIARKLGNGRIASRALSHLATVAMQEGEFTETALLAEESRTLALSEGDDHLLAFAMNPLAIATFERGDHRRARELLEEAARLLAQSGDGRNESLVQSNAAMAALLDGDRQTGLAALERSIEIRKDLGDRGMLASAHANFGTAAAMYGDLRDAEAHLVKAARLATEAGEAPTLLAAINGLAGVLARRGELLEAALLRGAVERVLEESQMVLTGIDGLVEDVLLKQAAADMGEEAWLAAKARGGTLTLDEALESRTEAPELRMV